MILFESKSTDIKFLKTSQYLGKMCKHNKLFLIKIVTYNLHCYHSNDICARSSSTLKSVSFTVDSSSGAV